MVVGLGSLEALVIKLVVQGAVLYRQQHQLVEHNQQEQQALVAA